MQSKKLSLLESITNTAVGFVIALCVQLVIYPALNIAVSLPENLLITSIFTGVSILRGYVIRRFFTNQIQSK